MMKAAAYVRMSTNDQPDSPARQKAQIELYAADHGLVVERWYQDDGMAGWDEERPQFQRLLADANAGTFRVVLVDELSRLSRLHHMDTLEVLNKLRKARVIVHSASHGAHDQEDLVGTLMAAVYANKNAQETTDLARRTATELARKANAGEAYVGAAPFGYAYKTDEEGKRLRLIPGQPEHVAAVRRAFELYDHADHSIDSLAAALTAEGIPNPGKGERWSPTTLHGLLTNPVYAGTYVYGRVGRAAHFHATAGGRVKPADKARRNGGGKRPRPVRNDPTEWVIRERHHEPLVQQELFDRVQSRLNGNRKRYSRNRKMGTYPLAQLLTCAHCGSGMFGTRDRLCHPVYRCSGSEKKLCPHRSAREDVLVPSLLEGIQTWLNTSDTLPRLRNRIAELQSSENDSELRANALRDRITRLEKDIEKAGRALPLLDPVNIPTAQERLRELRKEKAEALVSLQTLSTPPTEALDDVVGRLSRLAELGSGASPHELRRLFQKSISRVELHFGKFSRKTKNYYPLEGGLIYPAGCEVVSVTGPGRGRRTAPPPQS